MCEGLRRDSQRQPCDQAQVLPRVDPDRIEADLLDKGESPKKAFKAYALGRRVMATGGRLRLLWALEDEEARRVIASGRTAPGSEAPIPR